MDLGFEKNWRKKESKVPCEDTCLDRQRECFRA
ncbi:hypothetical protein OIU74_015378 [Salix koriyanagi]|uniref:Uncharacterized protein n=1 Tax=Salix koriyanagi TaxID=2511006 RepID=A0A9Q0PXX0_9ROSI|nr:hypothetical protein OIU74_015378 [Salix koriyanagi]